MQIKKILSVFLVAVMLVSVMSLGLTGIAAEIDYDTHYRALAEELKNEHVRELTNYTVSNTTLDNKTEGFDQEARGFAYDHRVTAKDNDAGDILKASNRFYYLAENLMSYKYGVGCYDAKTLVKYISDKIKPYFTSTSGTGEVIYEDFYGSRYYPSEEELKAYKDAVSLITATGATVNQATLTEFGIYFMEMNDWSYYNVDTILKYFVGNVDKINTGNWYHRFSFIVQTSISDILEECEGIDSIYNYELTIRTAVYEFDYQQEYNESMSKSYYCFAPMSLKQVYEDFVDEFKWEDGTSADLTAPIGGFPNLLWEGQAQNYMIKETKDTTTVPYLQDIDSKFEAYIEKKFNSETKEKWDSSFVSWSDDTVKNHQDTPIILGYAADLSTNYSNKALKAMFGDKLGNMVTLAYLFKESLPDYGSLVEYEAAGADPMADSANPSRIVRGNAPYIATAKKLDDIIHDLDALVAPQDDELDDVKISNRVATVLSMFLDIGGLLGIEDEIDYSTLEDLIGKVLQQLVFSDSIVNMLVELLYPMITNLLTDLLGNLTGVGFIDGLIGDILTDVIDDNDLAIYPQELGARIEADYPGQFTIAATILKNTPGNSWENVSFEAITWGLSEVPAEKKGEAFLEALCAGLSGFTRLLVCFLCGDEEYEDTAMQSVGNFGRYFDLKILPALSGWLVSQGLYTKLFIPLYRVLGLQDGEFLSSEKYHAGVVKDLNSCLREAVRPIVTWVTNHVAKNPFATIMKLVPNLVHFLSRTSTVELSHAGDWSSPSFVSGSQDECHKGFSDLQTYNLWKIMENVYVAIVGIIGVKIWSGSIASFLSKQSGMLSSLNALLNEVLKFTYDTDEVYSKNIACYSSNTGTIVLPDSTEYALNPSAYPNAHMKYYSDASNTQFSLEKDDAHPFEHENITYVAKPFYLPAIPEAKLISCGTINKATNTVDVEHPGLVFKFLLRYVISALGYRYDLNEPGLPTLIECLGLDTSGELFMGLSLGDIIDNVMLHPDEAICALLELFYSNEEGSLYTVNESGEVVTGKSYTYPVEHIDYHASTLLNKTINPTLTYGADVKYSEYWTREYANDFVSSLGPLAEDVLVMLGIEGMEDGLGPFLKNLLNENVFNNDLVNTLFNTIYQLIATLKDSVGMDIEAILAAVLDVNFTPITVARAVEKMIGYEIPATREIKAVDNWLQLFDGGYSVDPITGETTQLIKDVELDWGIDSIADDGAAFARADAFLRIVSALLSPAAFVLKFLFRDQPLSILGLINLPSYAGYEYAFIGLLEALSCPGVLSYKDYYTSTLDSECGDAYVIYNLFSPLLKLLEKVYLNPVDTLLTLLPNFLFFISIGGLNDLINNLVHFVYVLLDILKPIINGYDLLSGLLANIEISGLTLNLTLPLDIDVNSLISDLLGALVGDVLTIEGVSITLPYIDLYTLCAGKLEAFNTKQDMDKSVYLNTSGGGEFLTALLRIVFEVLFMPENHEALGQIISNLAGEGKLDAYDEETLSMVVDALFGLIEEYQVLDMLLFVVYTLITKLVPIADTLAPRFQANNMTITDLIDSASDMDVFIANVSLLLKDPEAPEIPDTSTDMNAITSLFDRIKALFEKIKIFFQQLFNFG